MSVCGCMYVEDGVDDFVCVLCGVSGVCVECVYVYFSLSVCI